MPIDFHQPPIRLSPHRPLLKTLEVPAGRDFRLRFIIQNRYGAGGEVPEGSTIRAKFATSQGGTPVLDLDSGSTTAAGSTVTEGELYDEADFHVVLAQGDTVDLSGRHYLELVLVDADDLATHLGHAEVIFVPTQGGSL